VLDGRYRLDAPIAAGGMGEVWRGTDLALSRAVAVKLLHPEQASHADGLARFRAEAQHAGSLSHPNIAQVYDYCEPAPPDPAYLVLELVDGPSLARQLDGGPISPERTLDVIEQAASGLVAAHRSGLLHRDIKPGNLLLSRDGLIKITDFGIARLAGSAGQTRTGALTGTPAYLAPERLPAPRQPPRPISTRSASSRTSA
jgi:eukaryotic-like serine/threonine-protein kinase